MRCKICVKHSPILSPPDWITLKTFKDSHQKTAIHLRCVGLQTREEEEEQRQQQNAPGFFATPNNITPIIPPSHQEFQQQHEPLSRDMMQELWNQFDGTFELDQGLNEAHEKARKDFHEHGLWDGPEVIAADIDMNNVEQLWDEEDQDDLLSEILEQMGLSHCFSLSECRTNDQNTRNELDKCRNHNCFSKYKMVALSIKSYILARCN